MNSTISYLYSRQNLGIKLGLDNTYALSERTGNPHKSLPCVQVVGTNGKGSTAAILANILSAEGYKVGLSTSPHLLHITERLRINGQSIPVTVIENFINTFKTDIEEIGSSFFEIITVLGLWYFVNEKVDIAIMETGLGGRLDSVTVCNPFVTLVTSISLDHTEILGDSISKIAYEKAGAFKFQVPVLAVRQTEDAEIVLKRQAKLMSTEIDWVDHFLDESTEVNLFGVHQRRNATLALESLKYLPFPLRHDAILSGLKTVVWHGRFQMIKTHPDIIFDVAHNSSGFASFIDEFSKKERLGHNYLIISLQSRKNIEDIIPLIEKNFDTIICTETGHLRQLEAIRIAEYFSAQVIVNPDPIAAIQTVVEQLKPCDSLAILGTHYIGEAIHKYFELSFDTL